MTEDIFRLLLKVNEKTNHEFEGYGGSNRDQRKYDFEEQQRYDVLLKFGLIKGTKHESYTITERGRYVAQHRSWKAYLDHIQALTEQKVRKEKNDLRISDFQIRTRNLPLIFSFLGLIVSIIALVITIRAEVPMDNDEIKIYHQEEKINKLDSNTSETQQDQVERDSLEHFPE